MPIKPTTSTMKLKPSEFLPKRHLPSTEFLTVENLLSVSFPDLQPTKNSNQIEKIDQQLPEIIDNENISTHPPLPDEIPLVSSFIPAIEFDALNKTQIELVEFIEKTCYKEENPIIIRNFCKSSKSPDAWLDLFSPDWLAKNLSNTEITVRDVELAKDHKTNISMFVEYLKSPNECPDEKLRNLKLYGKDLDCPTEWMDFIGENIPELLKYKGGHDLSSILPKNLQADNLMIYIGGDQTHTPLHTDICGSLGHNLMVWGDDRSSSFWFMVSPKNMSEMETFLTEKGKSLHTDSYFCPIEVLKKALFPIYFCEQKPGDFILLPANCVHQVLNKGSVSVKVAWNRLNHEILETCYEAVLPSKYDEYNLHFKSEVYRIRTLIHKSLLHLTSKINSELLNISLEKKKQIFKDLKTDIQLFHKMIAAERIEDKYQMASWKTLSIDCGGIPVYSDHLETPHTRICNICHSDIWNRGYYCPICATIGVRVTEYGFEYEDFDLCLECYASGRSCRHPEDMQMRKYLTMKQLKIDFEEAVRAYNTLFEALNTIGFENLEKTNFSWEFQKQNTISVATIARVREQTQKSDSRTCHSCKTARNFSLLAPCGKNPSHTVFCKTCLWNRFALKHVDVVKNRCWACPLCTDTCNCIACLRKRGLKEVFIPVPKDFVHINENFNFDPERHIAAIHDLALPRIKSKEIFVINENGVCNTPNPIYRGQSTMSLKRFSRESSVFGDLISDESQRSNSYVGIRIYLPKFLLIFFFGGVFLKDFGDLTSRRKQFSSGLRKRSSFNFGEMSSEKRVFRKRKENDVEKDSELHFTAPSRSRITVRKFREENKKRKMKLAIERNISHEEADEDTVTNHLFAISALEHPMWTTKRRVWPILFQKNEALELDIVMTNDQEVLESVEIEESGEPVDM
ncbi:hypothetical protein HK096_010244, partial [Nowakowskiella sp. JEL0078]